MKLVIAEKPSVAKDIASVVGASTLTDKYYEGNNYIVSWAVGHLLSLKMPEMYNEFYKQWKMEDLPIIPKPFEYYVMKNTQAQFKVLNELWKRTDVDTIICGTDAGREGELIFRLIANRINIKKNMLRLWISSMTEEAISEGFNNLKPLSNYDNLYYSALARQQADWLVGINTTRLYSIKAKNKLTSGRVQTPTLNLIVQRQKEIVDFKKSYYYNIVADFDSFKAIFYDENNNSKLGKDLATDLISKIINSFKVDEIKSEEKRIDRPLLYDLTTIQREANKKYSYSASETLDIIQRLYEHWKVVTYPRTDSSHLSEDMISTARGLLSKIKDNNLFNAQKYTVNSENMLIDKRNFDNSKVSDHHAIIPTNKITTIDFSQLSEKEHNILEMITLRFLASFSSPYYYIENEIILSSENYHFKAKSNSIKQLGWKEIILDDEKKFECNKFSSIKQSDILTASSISIEEKEVSPPKPYTEDTLLSAMENCKKYLDTNSKEFLSKGIGTPSTRAEVIEKLIQTEYIKREKRNLIPTEKGINFISIVDEKLKSIEISADWEEKLTFIEKGTLSVSSFLKDIEKYITEIIDSKTSIDYNLFAKKLISYGKCPICNSDILEGKKNFYCSNYKNGCSFSISKIIAQKELSNKNIADLLKKGSTAKIKGFKSKAGKLFDAKLQIDNGNIVFLFDN